MLNLTDGWLARAIAANEAGCTKSIDSTAKIIRAQFIVYCKEQEPDRPIWEEE
jgi:hypothetical protein